MASTKLMELRPGKGLDSGLNPSAEEAAGAIWREGNNVWFRETAIEHLLGRSRIVSSISRQSQALAQAFTQAGARRLYYEDLGIINYWEGAASVVIGNLSPAGDYDLETWGDWLLATDGIANLQLWENTGTFATAGDSASQFARCKIIKKLAQHVIAYNTNVFPTGFHWCSASNPKLWTPSQTNSARNLTIRNLDSEIVGVEPLGAAHAVYSSNTMMLVRYVGPDQWFGTPDQAIQGVGAVSNKSTISNGNFNYGISRAGMFATDGNSFTPIDRPALDKWLQENVDWDRKSTIAGYFDERLGLAIWSLPMISGGRRSIGMDPRTRAVTTEAIYLSRKSFTMLDANFGAGLGREIFDYPIVSLTDGIYYASLSNTLAGNFAITSHLQDAGEPAYYKLWDYVIIPGKISSTAQIRLGYADEPKKEIIEWTAWQNITSSRVAFAPRESVYLAIDLKATEGFNCSGIFVYGEKAGSVS
jgi:hypothetical protein